MFWIAVALGLIGHAFAALMIMRHRDIFVERFMWREPSKLEAFVGAFMVLFAGACLHLEVLGRIGQGGPWFMLVSIVWMASMFRPILAMMTLWLGLGMNMIAVIANDGRMPANLDFFTGSFRHQPYSDSASFSWLCDVIPLWEGDRIVAVFSLGDVFLCIGFWWIGARLLGLHLQQKPPATRQH